MIRRLLIANRGEIAARIARTCRKLGVEVVAVYSEADRGALHVELADEAVAIGPAPARESYLSIPRMVEAASAAGCDAVHPGYGFLSENAAFARAVEEAGVAFVGPDPDALEALGDKRRARALAREASAPVLDGFEGELEAPSAWAAKARAIGFPLLIKAAAGGGGKGMRAIEREEDFEEAFGAAQREALGAFGDGSMFLERLAKAPRHIEVQIFGDGMGDAVHLYERDCSMQRRRQKVIEEAPAPALPPALRDRLCECAVAIAKKARYRGAGTIEFLVEPDGAFHFVEANARLQVEHPATEMATGLDLVEWQLRIASGEGLPLAQEQIGFSGWAIEARLYAEDPARGFLPQTGRLERFGFEPGPGLRIEAGYRAGDVVTEHYDPMLAKLIAHAPTRHGAIRRLHDALVRADIAGVLTNRAFLLELLWSPAFKEGVFDTTFLDQGGLERARAAIDADRAARAAATALFRARQAAAPAADPWRAADGFRVNAPAERRVVFAEGEALASSDLPGAGRPSRAFEIAFAPGGEAIARSARGAMVFHAPVDRAARGGLDAPPGAFDAPMPGRVVVLRIRAGERVEEGQTLAVMEAMKMEHRIAAPRAGVVAEVLVEEGARVEEGQALFVMADGEAD